MPFRRQICKCRSVFGNFEKEPSNSTRHLAFAETAEDFVDYFLLNENEVIELEMKNVFSRYTNDVIANCAFGIKCDSLKEEDNQFYVMGKTVTSPRGKSILRSILAAFLPKVFEVGNARFHLIKKKFVLPFSNLKCLVVFQDSHISDGCVGIF